MKTFAFPLAVLTAALSIHQASAATFNVANGDVAGLKTAIITANTNAQDDTIELAAGGTYTLVAFDNADPSGNPNGLPQIGSDGGKALTIHGNGATIQRSSVGGTPDFRILYVGSSSTVTITRLTIKNGKTVVGAGIYNDHALLSLQFSTVTGNTITANQGGSGGGIFNNGGPVNISDSVLSNNSAPGGFGGAIYNGGTSGSAAITITNSTLSQNTAAYAGGIYNAGGAGIATLSAVNSSFSQNISDFYGGGIFNFGNGSGNAQVAVSDSTFIQNAATNGLGGGIYNQGSQNNGSATLDINDSTFDRNSAVAGGAIYNDGTVPAPAIAARTSVAAAAATVVSGTTANVVNSTFSQNTSTSSGGGAIFNTGASSLGDGKANLNITSTTFSRNTALTGPGDSIYNYASGDGGVAAVKLDSTILLRGTTGVNVLNSTGTITSLGHNLSDDAVNGDGTTAPGGYLNSIGDQRNTDPKLDPAGLKSNGGPTKTVALLPGSPAIDHGDDSILGAPLNLSTDQRGYLRIVGAHVDCGAVELNQAYDFNGDGHPDYLFFRQSDLRTYVWYLNGPTAFSSASGPTLPAGWSVVGVGDFNGDGKPDLLLFHASDLRTYVYYMNGPNVFGSAPGPTLPAGWSVLDVGDFNGDGQPDLLLLHASDLRTYVYYMHGPIAFSSAPGPTLPAGWSMVGLGDFNGDGKPDLFFFNPTNLQTYVWYLNGPTAFSSAPGPTLPSGWSVAGVADFNLDGKPDLLLVHAGDLRTYVYYMNGVTVFSSAPGSTLPAGWNLVKP